MATKSLHSEKQLDTEDSSQRSATMAATSEQKENAIDTGEVDAKHPVAAIYPHGARLTAIVISLMLGMFLVALDNVSHLLRDMPQS